MLILLAFIVAPAAWGATGQQRPAYLDEPSRIVPPVGYSSGRRYPVFIPLPPTGTSSLLMARSLGLDPERQTDFILLLPPGRPQRSEYLPDFVRFVAWYEERVLADLARLLESYDADETRIYLGGYSLGGDLSWALAARNPDRFAGALIAGTRASYPVSAEALARMHETGFRGALLIGGSEDPARYRGINYVRSRFEQSAVNHSYTEYPGGHVMPPRTALQEQVRFVTGASLATIDTPRAIAAPPHAPARHLARPTRDRIALRIGVLDVTDGVWRSGRDSEAQLRVEWPWSQFYFHTLAGYSATHVSTAAKLHRLHQEVVLGMGGPGTTTTGGGFSGFGVGWDWIHRFDDGAARRGVNLVYVRGDRNLPFVPQRWHGGDRVDSLLTLRYALPLGMTRFIPEKVFNLHARYLLRLGGRVVLDAAAGAYTLPNGPALAETVLADTIDHRLEWELGLGLRGPAPFLWRLAHRSSASRPLPDGTFSHQSTWRLSLEYSF